jgi:hypothetical protein
MYDYNQHKDGVCKKCMLLQMYLVERRIIYKFNIELFRKLLITTGHIYLHIY